MDKYCEYYKGKRTAVLTDEGEIPGVITNMGSKHASVTLDSGHTVDVKYALLKEAGLVKTAQPNIIKEEDQDSDHFVLSKEETNKDGQMSVSYKITVNEADIWESEEITTNVYDQEHGWSAPDDFDDNKLDLIQSNAEAGFDLLVESYQTMQQNITESMPVPGEEGEGKDDPKDVPAFAPGEGPAGDAGGGGGEGTPLPEGAVTPGGAAADEEPAEGEEDAGEEFGESGEDAPPVEEPVAASVQTPFSRKIADKYMDNAVSKIADTPDGEGGVKEQVVDVVNSLMILQKKLSNERASELESVIKDFTKDLLDFFKDDEGMKDYLKEYVKEVRDQLLENTEKEPVVEKESAKTAEMATAPAVAEDLSYISEMIVDGHTSGYTPNWRLSLDSDATQADLEQIGQRVGTGSVEGEIPSGGWWSLTHFVESKKAKKDKDNRLHNNPQHRLNPILREEMARRGIPSGDTHDLELAEKLKDFDYGGPSKKSIKRIENKLVELEDENDG